MWLEEKCFRGNCLARMWFHGEMVSREMKIRRVVRFLCLRRKAKLKKPMNNKKYVLFHFSIRDKVIRGNVTRENVTQGNVTRKNVIRWIKTWGNLIRGNVIPKHSIRGNVTRENWFRGDIYSKKWFMGIWTTGKCYWEMVCEKLVHGTKSVE
jgi:hypothetical protein